MYKDLIEDKLYQLVDQFSERKINQRGFYSTLLNSIHPFYVGNVRTCKILFVGNIFKFNHKIKLLRVKLM